MKRLIIPSIFVPIVLVLLIGITTANASTNKQRIIESPHSGASTALSTGYDLSWYTIDGGGATFSTGGSYQLNGGFWGGSITNFNIYLPLMLKNF